VLEDGHGPGIAVHLDERPPPIRLDASVAETAQGMPGPERAGVSEVMTGHDRRRFSDGAG
jgi:hypothetical protein